MNTEIIDKLERDIVYGRLEAQMSLLKRDFHYWTGYVRHCKDLKDELIRELQPILFVENPSKTTNADGK